MINIIIDSPFLPKREIRLDESEWTIEKLTNVIASKIKVLGKIIDKNVVCYELIFSDGESYKICKINDYPLHLNSFTEKLVNMDKLIVRDSLIIKVSFSSEHFNRMGKSIKLLESDTLEHFIERSTENKLIDAVHEIVNLDNDALQSMEFNTTGLRRYSSKYIDYKISVGDKWKNILTQMKEHKMIGNNIVPENIETIGNNIVSENIETIVNNIVPENIETIVNNIDDIDDITGTINRLDDDIESKTIDTGSSGKNVSRCNCLRNLFRKKKSSDSLQSGFHYDFEEDHNHEQVADNNYNDDLSYHDDNILDHNETDGTMFYSWDNDDDFLLE
jgi:hypothetical protein